MQGQVLKVFDIQEWFVKYEPVQLRELIRDAYSIFKKDFEFVGMENVSFDYCKWNQPVVHLLKHFSIVQIEKFIPYIDQTIRSYENRDLNLCKGLVDRIEGGKLLLILLGQIVSGEKIWQNKKESI